MLQGHTPVPAFLRHSRCQVIPKMASEEVDSGSAARRGQCSSEGPVPYEYPLARAEAPVSSWYFCVAHEAEADILKRGHYGYWSNDPIHNCLPIRVGDLKLQRWQGYRLAARHLDALPRTQLLITSTTLAIVASERATIVGLVTHRIGLTIWTTTVSTPRTHAGRSSLHNIRMVRLLQPTKLQVDHTELKVEQWCIW